MIKTAIFAQHHLLFSYTKDVMNKGKGLPSKEKKGLIIVKNLKEKAQTK